MKERQFKHTVCKKKYIAHGDWYLQLTNPLHGQHMYCDKCDAAMFPSDMIWTDTGENVKAGLRTQMKKCSLVVRVLYNRWFLLLIAILSFALVFSLIMQLIRQDWNLMVAMFVSGVSAFLLPRIPVALARKLNDVEFD